MYCITRIKKVNDRTQITNAASHNLRLRTQPNIDASKSHQNKVLLNSLDVDVNNASSLQERLTAHYKQLGVKERSDNVLMLEFVATASPEFFKGKTVKQVDEWATHQLEFFKKEFGLQVKMAVLHQDELSPHLHIMLGTEIKSVKRYKNQIGEFFKETWSLNAKRYDRQFLVDFQTRFANWNKKYGLKRGVKGSMKKHNPVKEFYKMVDKALGADYTKIIDDALNSVDTGFLTGKASIEDVREALSPLLNKVLKQNKALREKFKFELDDVMQYVVSEKETIEAEKQELAERREVYKVAINEKAENLRIIKEQEKELHKLRVRNDMLEQYMQENLRKKINEINLDVPPQSSSKSKRI